VLAATAGLFVLSLGAMNFVRQQSSRSRTPEVMIDLTLPKSASLKATQEVVDRVEKLLKADPDVEHWSFYVGQGAIRFYLPLDAQLANDFFAQAVVVTKGHKVRDNVIARFEKAFATDFDTLLARVTPLELGPPVGWPLRFRVGGPDPIKTRELAHAFAQIVGQNTNTRNINYDWNELAKVIKVDVDQDRARALGISSQQLATNINAILSGTRITQMREGTYLIDIVARAIPEERAQIETLRNLMLNARAAERAAGADRNALPCAGAPLIWRRQRLPTVTVLADVVPGVEATAVAAAARRRHRRLPRQAAARLQRDAWRRHRGQRQGAGEHLRGVSAGAVHHGDRAHDPADELPAPVPRAADRSARAHRRGGRAADLARAHGLRGNPGHHVADRHGDPQLGDPDRPDRPAHRRRRAPVGGRDLGD
jgi:multidrug efflux pump subunit AcrB